MTTPGQFREPRAQRARLGGELRRLRLLAELSGEALGKKVGASQKTVSRIELGEALPSSQQITAWARATGAADQRALLLDLRKAVVTEVATLQEILAGGMAVVQRDIAELEAVTATMRNFEPGFIPGLLQSADYALRIMQRGNPHGAADVAEAATARMQRQDVLYRPGHLFEFIMTEGALRHRLGPPEQHAAALGHVASLATLEAVELAVIPDDAEVQAIIRCGFAIFEDRTDGEPAAVSVETPHSNLWVSEPEHVQLYRDQFDLFRQSALTGAEAVEFVRSLA